MLKITRGDIQGIFGRFFKKLNAPYRVSIINEESMTEAMTMHLTKKSVYLFLSSFLVLIFLVLSSLFLFTPLRYYIPGNNNNISRIKLMQMQRLADSLKKINEVREQYIFNLLQVANGGITVASDSEKLSMKQIEVATTQNLSKIDHASKYDYLKNQRKDSLDADAEKMKDSLNKNKNFKEKN